MTETAEIKGVSVQSVPAFVREHYKSRYDEWLASLSPPSREIVENALTSSWYPLHEGVIEPTSKVCDLFYDGNEEGAREMGRISAEQALTGVYKVFVRVGSPAFIISRASKIFGNMLRPGKLDVVESDRRRAVLHLQLPKSNRLLELRIAGWMEQALTVSGCQTPVVEITESIETGAPLTKFVATWQ